MKCLKGLIGIDESFKKDLKAFGNISKNHSKALDDLEDLDGDSDISTDEDGDSDIDAMVKDSMKGATDILKSLSHQHHHKKHSAIHSEYHKVEKRRTSRIKTRRTRKPKSAKRKALKRKRTIKKASKTHSLISQESDLTKPILNQEPPSSGSKHLMFPHETNLSPVNQTQAVQHHTLINETERNSTPGSISELVNDGTEEKVIKHIDYGKGKLETQVETIRKDKNGKIISRKTEKYHGKHLVMI
jgi:hypothetical protein